MIWGRKEKGNLYVNRDPLNIINDDEPRALYWYAYRKTFEELKPHLTEGSLINVALCLIANNNLKADDFHLRRKDRLPIGSFNMPGKSVHIAFSDNIHEVSGAILDKDAKRQDCLYILENTLGLAAIGYCVYYAPHANQPLHARLVHQTHIDNPEEDQVSYKARVQIAELFSENKIRCLKEPKNV